MFKKKNNYFLFLALFLGGFFLVKAPALATVKLNNPLKSDSIPEIIGIGISAVLGLVGSLALIMFIFGGITWMTAAGNEQSVTKGKNIIIWSALGLAVIFFSYAIVRFVIEAIGAK